MKSLRTTFLVLFLSSLTNCDKAANNDVLEEVEEEISPLVKTLSGDVMGIKEESMNGKTFFSYYSIPFAQPPVGKLRFKDPQKMIGKWEGVRENSDYPPWCPQLDRGYKDHPSDELFGDEDCLYMNIFTPSPNKEHLNLPVMVYIHGGGFSFGASDAFPPYVLMNHDIVYVSVQYRVGMLGFLSTEDAEAPGNLGLKDQTMALSWLQANVHLFGGDPVKITLFGESAGAASVHFQMLSPRSLGLFQRAILMSGSALGPWALGGPFKEVAEYVASKFDCAVDEGTGAMVACLQDVPLENLLPIQKYFNKWHINPFTFAPRIDGDFLPASPEKLMMEKRHKRMDIMSGVTSHEGAFYSMPIYTVERFRSDLTHNFAEIGPISLVLNDDETASLEQAVRVYDHYLGGVNIDENKADNLTKMFSDRYFHVAHDLTSNIYAKNVAKYNKKVFRYELSHRGQYSFQNREDLPFLQDYVSHAEDLFYLFTGGNWPHLERDDDIKLREITTTLCTNFATYGNPTPDDSLGFRWEATTPDHLTHLNLNPSPTMEKDNRMKTREFWASLPLKENFQLHPEKIVPLDRAVPKEGDRKATKEIMKETQTRANGVDKETSKRDEL